MDAARKRLLYYLLLNVFISVCATASVLFVYDRYFRYSERQSVEQGSAQAGDMETAPDSLQIATVVGAGIPSSEMVIVRNTGQTQANLTGWKLKDEDSNTYTFSDVTLLPGGAIQLHTVPGKDTLIDRYWELTASAWRSGETASLLDPAGIVRSLYKVP